MEQDKKPRWQYRFDNYKRAFLLLREAMELRETRELSQLEQEGIIQRFEYSWELSWNLLRDYLEHQGVIINTNTPVNIIRKASEANIINHADIWMKALDDRNKIAHIYSFAKFEEVINNIQKDYLTILGNLYQDMLAQIVEENANL